MGVAELQPCESEPRLLRRHEVSGGGKCHNQHGLHQIPFQTPQGPLKVLLFPHTPNHGPCVIPGAFGHLRLTQVIDRDFLLEVNWLNPSQYLICVDL